MKANSTSLKCHVVYLRYIKIFNAYIVKLWENLEKSYNIVLLETLRLAILAEMLFCLNHFKLSYFALQGLLAGKAKASFKTMFVNAM